MAANRQKKDNFGTVCRGTPRPASSEQLNVEVSTEHQDSLLDIEVKVLSPHLTTCNACMRNNRRCDGNRPCGQCAARGGRKCVDQTEFTMRTCSKPPIGKCPWSQYLYFAATFQTALHLWRALTDERKYLRFGIGLRHLTFPTMWFGRQSWDFYCLKW